MAERDDAGVSQDQVEREREQAPGSRSRSNEQCLASAPATRRASSASSKCTLPPTEAGVGTQALGRVRRSFATPGASRTSPCGRSNRITIIKAVDDEGAELGQVVLAGHVGHAQQQGGQEGAGDGGGAADRARRSGNRP